VLDNRNKEAFKLVVRFLTETFGERDKAWETPSRPEMDGSFAIGNFLVRTNCAWC